MPTSIFFNLKEDNLPFAIDNRIFLGEGLFETLRIVNSKILYSSLHWQRLQKSAHFLNIPFEISLELWIEKLNEFIQLKKMFEGGIKVILGSGKAPRGLPEKSDESFIVFDAFPYIHNPKPQVLVSCAWQRDANNPLYRLKSINYGEAIIARRHATAMGADEVLFFNFQNQATETSIANFFIIKNNCLLTPSLECGLLPGILRQRLLVLARKQGIDCFEVEMDRDNIFQADAAFTTNVLAGIRPVHSFDGHIFNSEHRLIDQMQASLALDPEQEF